jgi:thioredoxin-like negative regulator of GroEL
MGMRIASSGMASSAMSSVGGAAKWQAQRQNFGQLSQALQSGDLAGAQKVFSTISANSTKAADPTSPMGKVGAALQAGDIQGAQQAFAAMRSGGHHHAGATASTQTPDATASAASGQTLEQKLESLLSSLNSANTSNQSTSNATPAQTLASIINSLKGGIGGSYVQAQMSSTELAGSLINMTA